MFSLYNTWALEGCVLKYVGLLVKVQSNEASRRLAEPIVLLQQLDIKSQSI